jgi:hypothetical protein
MGYGGTILIPHMLKYSDRKTTQIKVDMLIGREWTEAVSVGIGTAGLTAAGL